MMPDQNHPQPHGTERNQMDRSRRARRHVVVLFPVILVSAVTLRCSSEDSQPEGGNTRSSCSYPLEHFAGGTTSLTIDRVIDGCMAGLVQVFLESYYPEYRGPHSARIPGYTELLAGTATLRVDGLPLVGSIEATAAVSGNSIGVSVPQRDYEALGCRITAAVSGLLSPCSSRTIEGHVDLEIATVQGQGCPLSLEDCTISFSVSGG
jgi:hypothetical protein